MIQRLRLNEAELLSFSQQLQAVLPEHALIFLQGQLGAGKTTFVRGLLRAAGYQEAVRSPTFTIVEEYQIAQRFYAHLDLYRLSNAEELEWLGIRDYLEQGLVLIEWAEHGAGVLPAADLTIEIKVNDDFSRDIHLFGALESALIEQLQTENA